MPSDWHYAGRIQRAGDILTEEEARERFRNENYGDDYSEYYVDGERLKAIRISRGMTQTQLAKASGYKFASAIHRLENRDAKIASKGVPVVMLRMITDALGIPMEYVLVKKPGWLIEKEREERESRGEY